MVIEDRHRSIRQMRYTPHAGRSKKMALSFTNLLYTTAAEDYLRAAMEGYIAKGRMAAEKRSDAEALIEKTVADLDAKDDAWFEDFAAIQYPRVGEAVVAKYNRELRAC